MHQELTVPPDQSVLQAVNALLETAVDISIIKLQAAHLFQPNIHPSKEPHLAMEPLL